MIVTEILKELDFVMSFIQRAKNSELLRKDPMYVIIIYFTLAYMYVLMCVLLYNISKCASRKIQKLIFIDIICL